MEMKGRPETKGRARTNPKQMNEMGAESGGGMETLQVN